MSYFRTETGPADLHPLPDAGAGEGIPLQSVPHQTAQDRDRSRPLPDREADQDLVPEQTDEVEEGEQGEGGGRGRAGRESGAPKHLIGGEFVLEKHFWVVI